MQHADRDEARTRAIDLLRRAAGADGFVASPGFEHYRSIWTRDAAIAVLASIALGDPSLIETSLATVRSLGLRAGRFGQIPDAYWPDREYWDWGEAGATDASAWFVVMACLLDEAVGIDEAVWVAAESALDWLRRQDATNSGLIDSPPASDWMDSSLMRGGRVFHVNLLYWWAARLHGAACRRRGGTPLIDAADLKRRIDLLFWPTPESSLDELYAHVRVQGRGGGYDHAATSAAHREASHDRHWFLSHVAHAGYADRCDVLANVLAVYTGFATDERVGRLLAAVTPAATPYPSRSWLRPFTEDDDPWAMWNRGAERTIPERWRNPPYRYHNAAVWPFVGGFHAAALAVAGRIQEARETLGGVAAANERGEGGWGFHEWLDGWTGEPGGASQQVWNAGAYVVADRLIGE